MIYAPKMFHALFGVALITLGGNAAAATVLTEADAKAPILVRVGETIELRLSENPSTGYAWSVAFDPPDAAAVTYSHWKAQQGGAVGAPGTRDLSIAIRRAGNLVIRANNGRSWEGDASVTKRLEFLIEAR
ncbi:protease inhibitor I42 family protein [uncultured Rhodoblastus sp.]|uniref:protease inhibitor I42 family protein n=1 Tax=uncultured Rhodoblastus sp. TaxID=543037 RepID=UPI0025E44A96|nr:protease inhibitor I42 family protein [uncultured Rhodoblastus sp.]